jgi:hypothetical protein
MIEPPRLTMPVLRVDGHRDDAQQHAGVHGDVVDALLRPLLPAWHSCFHPAAAE